MDEYYSKLFLTNEMVSIGLFSTTNLGLAVLRFTGYRQTRNIYIIDSASMDN